MNALGGVRGGVSPQGLSLLLPLLSCFECECSRLYLRGAALAGDLVA